MAGICGILAFIYKISKPLIKFFYKRIEKNILIDKIKSNMRKEKGTIQESYKKVVYTIPTFYDIYNDKYNLEVKKAIIKGRRRFQDKRSSEGGILSSEITITGDVTKDKKNIEFHFTKVANEIGINSLILDYEYINYYKEKSNIKIRFNTIDGYSFDEWYILNACYFEDVNNLYK